MSRTRGPFARRPLHPARPGSAYVLVLMTTVIVMVIGLSAVSVARIEHRRQTGAADALAARGAARAAAEFAFLKIRRESNWNNLGGGNADWASNVPFDGGTYSLTRLAYDNADPINPRLTLLTVGRHGDAVAQFRVVIVRGAWVDASGWMQVVN